MAGSESPRIAQPKGRENRRKNTKTTKHLQLHLRACQSESSAPTPWTGLIYSALLFVRFWITKPGFVRRLVDGNTHRRGSGKFKLHPFAQLILIWLEELGSATLKREGLL